ncbi:MAG TPA: homoserine kinase [Acidimicrobiales bacterium]|nr:homoserine kinase [Acidimicrobiales bacterium]
MRARAPASSANLGPGYDALALALGLHCEVTVEPAARLELTSEGEGAGLPLDAGHLAARVVRLVLGHDDVAIHVRSEIPVARGLGSSGALALAAAAAAGAAEPLALAVGTEGHAENAAASLLGGLVAAAEISGRPVARRLPLDPRLSFVVVVPERELATTAARAVLPERVPLADAVFNLGRMGLLVAGLGDAAALVGEAGEDRLHQDARSALFPEAPELLGRLRGAGAAIATWSGAGPSLLAVSTGEGAGALAEAGERALEAVGLAGRVLQLPADLEGLVVG